MGRIRKIFQVIFLVSIGILAYLLLGANTADSPSQTVSVRMLVWVPVFTAIISLLGWVTTTIFAFKQSKLESKRTALELTKIRLEIKDKEIELAMKQHALDEMQKKEQSSGEK